MSNHSLTVGRSLSGKSALNKQIGSRMRLAGAEILAWNPTLERGYAREDEYGCIAAEWETDDPQELIAEIQTRYQKEKKERFLIIDEAHELPTELSWLGTKGRHYGLTVMLITQRGAKMNPTLRTQVGTWYVFKCSGLDMKMVQEETGVTIPKDMKGAQLGQFDYLKITIHGAEKRNLIDDINDQ
jgi:hypothetical protein